MSHDHFVPLSEGSTPILDDTEALSLISEAFERLLLEDATETEEKNVEEATPLRGKREASASAEGDAPRDLQDDMGLHSDHRQFLEESNFGVELKNDDFGALGEVVKAALQEVDEKRKTRVEKVEGERDMKVESFLNPKAEASSTSSSEPQQDESDMKLENFLNPEAEASLTSTSEPQQDESDMKLESFLNPTDETSSSSARQPQISIDMIEVDEKEKSGKKEDEKELLSFPQIEDTEEDENTGLTVPPDALLQDKLNPSLPQQVEITSSNISSSSSHFFEYRNPEPVVLMEDEEKGEEDDFDELPPLIPDHTLTRTQVLDLELDRHIDSYLSIDKELETLAFESLVLKDEDILEIPETSAIATNTSEHTKDFEESKHGFHDENTSENEAFCSVFELDRLFDAWDAPKRDGKGKKRKEVSEEDVFAGGDSSGGDKAMVDDM